MRICHHRAACFVLYMVLRSRRTCPSDIGSGHTSSGWVYICSSSPISEMISPRRNACRVSVFNSGQECSAAIAANCLASVHFRVGAYNLKSDGQSWIETFAFYLLAPSCTQTRLSLVFIVFKSGNSVMNSDTRLRPNHPECIPLFKSPILLVECLSPLFLVFSLHCILIIIWWAIIYWGRKILECKFACYSSVTVLVLVVD